jgi:tRNA 2-thiouridine synthesizing protein A
VQRVAAGQAVCHHGGMAPHPRTSPVITIDALGRKCPIPIIMLAERIREVPVGEIITVLADDPAARTDLPAWCAMKAQQLVGLTDLPSGWAFHIRRTC